VDVVRSAGTVVVSKDFSVTTPGRLAMLDVTAEVEKIVESAGIREGTAFVFSPHTTCSVVVAAAHETLVDAIESMLASVAPPDGYYAHDDLSIRTENLVVDEPANGPAHIAHILMGQSSETLPIVDGRVVLGTNQRILFVELDSARDRRYLIQVMGT